MAQVAELKNMVKIFADRTSKILAAVFVIALVTALALSRLNGKSQALSAYQGQGRMTVITEFTQADEAQNLPKIQPASKHHPIILIPSSKVKPAKAIQVTQI